jgi:ankyrin repeat protein
MSLVLNNNVARAQEYSDTDTENWSAAHHAADAAAYSCRASYSLEALIEKTTPAILETLTSGSRAGGRTVLALLVESGKDVYNRSASLVEKLLEKSKVLLECKDWRGNTPLHQAAAAGNPAVVRVLVNAGACVLAENLLHQTVWQKADKNPRVKAELIPVLMRDNPRGDWKHPKSASYRREGGMVQKKLRSAAHAIIKKERILAFR